MRGYLSFVLVLYSLVLVFTLLQLFLFQTNLSSVVLIHRAYGLEMNAKEAVQEALRQGSLEGFDLYDKAHDVKLCKHCPDSFCSPPALPRPFNVCDPYLCSQCFRETEAKSQSQIYALAKLSLLANHSFDSDFHISLSFPEIEIMTRAAPHAKNGFALDYLRFNKPMRIFFSSKFNLSGSAAVPADTVINYD